MKEVLLLSGGIDSVALAYWRRPAFALTVDYGQSAAEKEIDVARYIAKELNISHRVIRAGIASLGLGTMTGRSHRSQAPTPEWWPFRNQFLISLAAMMAVKEEVTAIVIGSVSTDSAHADGTLQFVQRCQDLLSCQESSVLLLSPALLLTSPELVRRSGIPSHLLASTHSCHRGTFACGECRGCLKHEAVFEEVGLL